jgi:phage baseplate assembly protein V|tara:strand:- start:211 stop:744 length:534 start_codon:yes stop_codon:yes gene_type:complete
MNNIAELLRLIENLIRLGTIAEVDHGAPGSRPPRCRVKSGEITTAWLPWISVRAGQTRDWDPPTKGEQCLLFSPGGDLSAGVALVGINSAASPSPSHDPNVIGRWYPDGTRIEYDHVKKALTVDCVGDVIVKAAGKTTIDATSIHHNGGKGIVTQGHVCHFTGNPHGDGSSTVTAGK